MRMKTKRILKRAVPIVMAVIMILGVIGSAMMSMMTAHADETGIHAANSPEGRAKKKYNDMNAKYDFGKSIFQDLCSCPVSIETETSLGIYGPQDLTRQQEQD